MHDNATNYNIKAVAMLASTAFYPFALGGDLAARHF